MLRQQKEERRAHKRELELELKKIKTLAPMETRKEHKKKNSNLRK